MARSTFCWAFRPYFAISWPPYRTTRCRMNARCPASHTIRESKGGTSLALSRPGVPMNQRRYGRAFLAAITAIAGFFTLAIAQPASAQYFGQNKVQFEKLNFKTLKTAHFDIYFYDEEKEAAEIAGRLAERWYTRLSTILGHQLTGRQPLVLFASHPHFQQTNVVE